MLALALCVLGGVIFAAIGAWVERDDNDLSWDDYWKYV